MVTDHSIYDGYVKQLTGLIAERDALVAANAAKQVQIAGLVEERDALLAALADAEVREKRALAEARKWRRAFSGEEEV